MKVKTADLIEPALSYAVSVTLGHFPEKDFHSHGMTWSGWWETAAYIDTKPNEYRRIPRYSIDWSQSGSIIERGNIGLEKHRLDGQYQWAACDWHPVVVQGYTCLERSKYVYGPTPLIAAMRCFVSSKLGDEVDVPEELL